MEAYYQQQPVSYISGQYRQRGNGFGHLTAGIGMAALRIARKFLWSVAKKIGLEIIVQAVQPTDAQFSFLNRLRLNE